MSEEQKNNVPLIGEIFVEGEAPPQYYQAFLDAQAKAEEAAERAEDAAAKIEVDQEYIETKVFSVGQGAEVAAAAARDAQAAAGAAAQSEQNTKNDADRAAGAADDAEAAKERAEEVADSVGSPVSYKAQTLSKEEQGQVRENIGLTVFGVPYSSAAQVVDISAAGDGSVKLHLFLAADGYDAVVTGKGNMQNYPYSYDANDRLVADLSNRNYDVAKIFRLHIESSVTHIGDLFMYNAFNLKHVSFGASKAIEYLGAYSFAYTSISGKYEFTGLTNKELHAPFMHCPKLEELTFSSTATAITKRSFQMCIALRTVKGISNVTTIGDAAFQYCTSLESIDVVPGNVTLRDWVFILTPNDAKAGDTVLMDAPWKGQGDVCFAQNKWTADQLSAIQAVTGKSVKFPIPESDNQGTDFYKQWGAFPWPYNDLYKDTGHPASGCCGIFSLYHIYNILHPNSQYDTFYDWMMREIVPHKITVTQSLHDALAGSGYLPNLIACNTDISYEVGSEITARDLPMALDIYSETWGNEGTSFWGCCEAMGWTATEMLFDGSTECGANVKRTILDNLAANKPVEMETVGAADGVHGMHAVVAIGYDADTDKLLIIDSTGGFDADVVPLSYWCSFESLITPHEASAIWTFDFGEEITMTEIDDKLGGVAESNARIEGMLAAINSGFRIVTGTDYTMDGTAFCIPLSEKPKLVIWRATDDTQKKIVAIANTEQDVAKTYDFASIVTFAKDLDTASLGHAAGRNGATFYFKYLSGYGVCPGAGDTSIYYENAQLKIGTTGNIYDKFDNGDGTTTPAEYEWIAYYWDE